MAIEGAVAKQWPKATMMQTEQSARHPRQRRGIVRQEKRGASRFWLSSRRTGRDLAGVDLRQVGGNGRVLAGDVDNTGNNGRDRDLGAQAGGGTAHDAREGASGEDEAEDAHRDGRQRDKKTRKEERRSELTWNWRSFGGGRTQPMQTKRRGETAQAC